MREIPFLFTFLISLFVCKHGAGQEIRALPPLASPAAIVAQRPSPPNSTIAPLPPLSAPGTSNLKLSGRSAVTAPLPPITAPLPQLAAPGKTNPPALVSVMEPVAQGQSTDVRIAKLPVWSPPGTRPLQGVLELEPPKEVAPGLNGEQGEANVGAVESFLDEQETAESPDEGTDKKDFLASAADTFAPWPKSEQGDVPPIPASLKLDAGFSGSSQSLTWWKEVVRQPLDPSLGTETVDANILVYLALRNSPRIQAISQEPLIRELQIVEADAEFDAVRYVRSQFEDRVDPVGNTLTVGGGESFLKDNLWSADAGFRRKIRNGAQVELNQRLGFQNSNSNFFSPQDQGTATLALNVTQPLLRGRGAFVNQAQILIAQAAGGSSWETFQAELQDELLAVINAYWQLYLNRSVYLQKKKNVERGEKILNRLEGRSGLDSLPNQIARARSSVQTRKTELANGLRDVRNAETEIRRLIADTSWMSGQSTELVPGELPSSDFTSLPLEQIVSTALNNRPEIREAMNRARIATIQQRVSANELLPELSLLFGTYVSALRGDTGIINAFQDQFGQVKPGYNVGFNFELPYGNRAARSRFAQRRLQVKKITAEVDEVAQNVIAESQVALRRVESAAETLVAAEEAIRAARADKEQFEKRWESFALVEGDLADGQTPTTILDQLLESHDRLASAELVFVQAEQELKISEFAMQRAMGTLLMRQNVSTLRSVHGDTPRMDIIKDGAPVEAGYGGMPQGQMDPVIVGESIEVQQIQADGNPVSDGNLGNMVGQENEVFFEPLVVGGEPIAR